MVSSPSETGKFTREALDWLNDIPSVLGEVIKQVKPVGHSSQLFHLLHVLRPSRTFIEEQRLLASFITLAVSTAGDKDRFAQVVSEESIQFPKSWMNEEHLISIFDRSATEILFHVWLKRHQGIRGFDDPEKVISRLATAVVNKSVASFLSWWIGALTSDEFTQVDNIKGLLTQALL